MQTVDLDAALPILLGVAGSLLQFIMRQFEKVGDAWYHLAAVGLTAMCFILTVRDWPHPDWRDSAVVLIVWVAGHLLSVYGGTFITSNAARKAAEAAEAKGVNVAGNPFVPVTSSKP